ncbi:uncharacterized protein LOC119832781 isoform X1 [Zerene cesonia]|uniref:uncharacterized protein LOC119832781 isoform X1 n=1 Tax=Zerene cesonia TaxID=33412 RepID=UPI0018E55415|nr:uncharacterized protein LOC119832781 isoform X1 [Zerene cesonia]
MRSQASKPLAKKGALNKTSFKTKPVKKRAKKKVVSTKKVKALQKSVKNPKKNKDENAEVKTSSESIPNDNPSTSTDTCKAGTSKPNNTKAEAFAKKAKKDPKEKKDLSTPKTVTKKIVAKKSTNVAKKAKPTPKVKKGSKEIGDNQSKNVADDNKKSGKSTKSKASPKKGNVSGTKSKDSSEKFPDTNIKEEEINDSKNNEKIEKEKLVEGTSMAEKAISDDTKPQEAKSELEKTGNDSKTEVTSPKSTSIILSPKTPKSDVERPPKFFTSTRSPRTVDIDIKCCKNSKGNLSVSERFLSMKCETKAEENKEKTSSNTLVAQGPEIDVYTFTEKVDSPKSILSDFRNPINKNVGRVRPIARVKGTVIDKKNETEKKKYSPHRPIEEVVKQLKASKKSEETSTSPQQSATFDLSGLNKKDEPKPIVSKSYKMVARKSSVTGKPFSPTKFLEQDSPKADNETIEKATATKKSAKCKKPTKKNIMSDEEIDSSKFALSTKIKHYSSSEESVSESNDDHDSKESSGSESPKNKKAKNKKYKRITDTSKKNTSKELKELSKDSLIDLKDTSALLGNEKPSKRRLKLLSMWSGPKKHRMASLNALAKVHCLYENESRSHVELGLMKTVERQPIPGTSKVATMKKKEPKIKESEKESTSESEYETKKEKEKESSDSSDDNPPQRTLRGVPGIRSAGKYWDPKSSTSSSEDSELESKAKVNVERKKTITKTATAIKSDSEKPSPKMKKTAGVPVKKKRNRNEVVMDLKDMVVQKRMASLNATAILAASYEKRSPKSSKDESTSDSCSDESFSQKPKNVKDSGVKSEVKNEDTKKDIEEPLPDRKQKVEVIVNQDTDVTITGVYSTHHHEGFCTVSGMQYRISSTSHTQTTATANCEKEGCSRDDGARYTPLSALSSMQPPAEHTHPHPHPVPELGGLTRRPGCSSAFSAPSPAAHHDPGKPTATCTLCDPMPRVPYGYYQPAGPLIKESSADAERALTRYHPAPHYHTPHPPVLQQYGPYYPTDLCYGRYYRPPGPYHMAAPQPDAPMVGVGNEPYPPPQYYGTPPCYQHSPQRIPYVEYRGCPCPLNACPKNVLIGPATGKAPTGGGPVDVTSALEPPGGAFRPKVRACALDSAADTHGSGKDPPLELEPPEPPTAADAPHPCPLPAMGGASPKRELFDARDTLRLAADLPGSAEAVGPPSPARGSAGACAPQPPPVAPRRARLGKAMARRSLAGDDTALLLTQQPPQNNEADDDVLAISPPICVPIDLSSSDERSTPLVDVKKENEGPTYASSRKTDTQALKEHNCTTALTEITMDTDAAKPVKRRHSRPKLEIEMKDVQLEDVCKTNGIGEHVKLQKRRKVSGELTDMPRIEIKETKKRKKQNKKSPKIISEKKATKRKSDLINSEPKAKKMLIEGSLNKDTRVPNIMALHDLSQEDLSSKPKTKSAEVLDNLIKKNSVERTDIKGYAPDGEINPAALFLVTNENTSQNCTKKTLNINNNVVDSNNSINGVTPETIAAVSQLIEKKLANKNAYKVEKVNSKITHNIKSVLNSTTPNESVLSFKEEKKSAVLAGIEKCTEKSDIDSEKYNINPVSVIKNNCELPKVKSESVTINNIKSENCPKTLKALKSQKAKIGTKSDSEVIKNICDSSCESQNIKTENNEANNGEKMSNENQVSDFNILDKVVTNGLQQSKLSIDTANGDLKRKTVEKVVKLLVSKRQAKNDEIVAEKDIDKIDDNLQLEKSKRCKLTEKTNELKGKNVEKVAKLLVSKKTVIKTDEAALVIEDACSSPVPGLKRRARRRRSGARRMRRVAAPLAPPDLKPRPPPRWSNGWNWDGDYYLSKVYLNNDSRLDRTARCWSRMTHASGDRVARGDCVLLRASQARAQPFVARVASLWENPDDGEMMVSLVWYYRPEHTERGRQAGDAPDEVYASRHKDANSVACIEDKCYVLTFNEYCRYRKRLKAIEEGITIAPSIVPPLPASEVTPAVAPNDTKLPPSVSPDLVLFCRKIYDFRSKKIHVPNK